MDVVYNNVLFEFYGIGNGIAWMYYSKYTKVI